MIYIDADETKTTWRTIAEIGGYTHYQGHANRGDIVIRWGANHGRYTYPEGIKVLNKHLVMSKLDQGILFAEHQVPSPQIFQTALQWERAGRPICLIKPIVGQMGTGIRRVERPRWIEGHIIQRYIEKEREFRAMMVGNLMAFFMEKHPPQNGDFRWNEHRGAEWTGVPEDRQLRRTAKEICSKALAALEYDFGAVDIIKKGNDIYVLEVNSRPEFGQINADRFVRAIGEYLARR